LIHYILKVGKYDISISISIYITTLIICLFTNCFMKTRKRKSSRYYYCSNVWDSEDWNAFLFNLLDSFANIFYRCVDIWKIFRNEIYLFSFGQSMENIIMVKVRYFCMRQRMMWDNVVNLSHILCQQVQHWKLYK